MTTSPPPAPALLTARSPEDLLAVVPVVLGFHPADSVVMLTLGAGRSFHARSDLPPPGRGSGDLEARRAVDELAETLLRPVLLHRVPSVAFVVYTADERHGDRVASVLRRRFRRAGVTVLPALRADGGRWWTCPAGSDGVPRHGVPYDVSAHPFVAQAVVEGRVTLRTREELAATCAADAQRAAEVGTVLTRLEQEVAALDPEPRLEWLMARTGAVWQHVAAGSDPAAEESAALLLAIAHDPVRDLVLRGIDRDTARDHVRLWSALVRSAPTGCLPRVGLLLAWAAWQAGDGALAWCALDRAAEADTPDPLLALMSRVLTDAVPPWAVDELWGEPVR